MAEILLGNIRGPKGEQGKAFEFSDFTAEQLESLRGPKGETGKSTKTVTVEFSTRPTYTDRGNDNGGTQALGNVPSEYFGVLTAGDFVVIPMVHGEDGSDVIVVGEFVDYQYNSDGQGFGIIFKNLAAIKGSIGPSGKDGATFTPAVDSNGNLSWTNNGNLTNPASVNIKGPQGEVGPKGEAFKYSDFTQAQLDELKGPQGLQGKDGVTFTPSVSADGTLSWVNNGGLTNPASVSIKGPKGDKGESGGVQTVNGVAPDENGDVTIEVGGGSGDAIPKTGNRGVLAGFEQYIFKPATFDGNLTLDSSTPDVSLALNVNAASLESMAPTMDGDNYVVNTMTKVVLLANDGSSTVTLGSGWYWKDMEVPTFGSIGLLVFHKLPHPEMTIGFVMYIQLMA